MASWEASGVELPTKFNKYKRLKQKEAAVTDIKSESSCFQTSSDDSSCSSHAVSVGRRTPPAVTNETAAVQQLEARQKLQLQQPLTDRKPDILSFNGINRNNSFPGTEVAGNGHPHLNYCSDRSANVYPGSINSPLDLQRRQNTGGLDCSSKSLSKLQQRQSVLAAAASPHLDDAPKLTRLVVCTCGVCALCVRPLSADQITNHHHQYHRRRQHEEKMDVDEDVPCDLTVSSSSRSSPPSRKSSSSNCVPTAASSLRYSRQTVVTADSCSSSVVDEHFERSLGGQYARFIVPSSTVSSTTTSDKSGSSTGRNVTSTSVTADCVDDHFMKSLGSVVWQQMKENGDITSSASDVYLSTVEHCSVDDHFKKALGDETWHRLNSGSDQPIVRSSQTSRYPT